MRLDGKKVVIPANVSHDDQLFGSVGPRDIVEAFADQGIEVDANAFRMHENFKKLGTYKVDVDLFEGVECQVTVQVVDANPEGPGLDEAIEDCSTVLSLQPSYQPAKALLEELQRRAGNVA